MSEGLQSHDQTRFQKSVSEERNDQEKGNGVNPACLIEHANSYDDANFKLLENNSLQVMLERYKMIELGPWARGPSNFFSDINRGLEETDKFIRSNICYDANLVEKNRGEYNTMNLNEEKQLMSGGELQIDYGNPPNGGPKDKILGLEGLQNRTKGSRQRRLTKIHDVDMTNEIEDVSPRKNNDAHSRDKPSSPLKTNSYVEGGACQLQYPGQDKQHESACIFFNKIVSEDDEDQNDYVCGLCGLVGDLVCCDGCPSTFHQRCLGKETLPSGKWYCMYCRCKICGSYGEKQKDNLEGSSKPLTCHICEQKYHQSCLEASGDNIVHSEQELLCGNGCKVIAERLKKLVGVKREMEDGFSWSFLRRENVDSNASQITPHMVKCNKKLAGALSLMKQAFTAHFDKRTGIDMFHSVVYNCGSNFPRLNHNKFVTAILERNDEIVSVASIRIHGNRLAEMPYVATRYIYRRKGMFKRLLTAIESALSFLNVELLVVPAILQLKETWIRCFGFETLDLRSRRLIKGLNLMVFSGTKVLKKNIPKRNFPDENFIIPAREFPVSGDQQEGAEGSN